MRNRALCFAYGLVWLATILAAIVFGVGSVNAVRDWAGPNRLIVPLSVQPAATAQLFFDRGAGIRAEDCANAWVKSGGLGLNEVVFQVPRVALRQLRLDPLPGDGSFLVGAPRLESATGRLVAQFPITAVVALHQIAELEMQGDHWMGRTVADANDPQLTLGLGAPLRVGRPVLPWSEAGVLILLGFALVALSTHQPNREFGTRITAQARDRIGALMRAILHIDRLAVIGVGVVVAVLELVQLWPLHRALDWPLWDEINYAARGAMWAKEGGDLGALHSSPLYVASYGALASLTDLPGAIFAQHYIVKLASTVLLYVVLVGWWRSIVAAAAVALYWGSTQFQLEFPLLVYHSAWVWFLVGIAVVARWPLAGLLLVAAAMAVRQEYQFAVVALIIALVWRQWRRRGSWRTWFGVESHWKWGAVVSAPLLVLVVALFLNSGFGSGEGRAWFAFQQHYAVRAVEEGDRTITNPWLEYRTLIDRDFPRAGSLFEAWRANPQAMMSHVGYNIRNLGTELTGLARAHERRPTAWLYLAVAGLALISPPRRKSGTEGVSGDLSTWAGASTGAWVVAPGMLVLAKGAYLLPVVPLFLGGIGALVQRFGRLTKVHSLVPVRLAGGLLVVVLFWGALSPRVFVAGERPRPNVETATILRESWPSSGRHVLLGVSASSFAHYIGDERCEGVEPVREVSGESGPDASLADWLERMDPIAVLVTNEWRSLKSFKAEEVTAALPESEWKRQSVSSGDIFWRKEP